MIMTLFLLFAFTALFSLTLSLKIGLRVMTLEARLLKKSGPFECGFNPKVLFRMNYSMQFFMVALLFLVFDVELLLIIPYLQKFFFYFQLNNVVFMLVLILIMLGGLIYEWNVKTLNWEF